MKEVSIPQDTLIDYLLGELSEKERDRVDKAYFDEPEMRECMLALEEELIDFYVQDRLAPGKRAAFERWFLSTQDRRKRLEFARALHRHLGTDVASEAAPIPTKPSRWDFNLDLFRMRSRLVFAIGGIVAFFALAIVYWQAPQDSVERVAQVRQGQIQTPVPEKSAVRPPTKTVPVISMLLAPTTRSTDSGNVLLIPPESVHIVLRLPLETANYAKYSVTVQNADTAGSQTLHATQSKTANEALVEIPSAALPDGDYIVALVGHLVSGESERVGAYGLQVRRKR